MFFLSFILFLNFFIESFTFWTMNAKSSWPGLPRIYSTLLYNSKSKPNSLFLCFSIFFIQASYSKLTIVFLYKRNINVYIYNIIYMKRKEKEIEGTNEEINKRIFESATLSTPSIFHNHIVDVAIHVLEENRYRERE